MCPLQVGFSLQRLSVFKDRFLTLASPGQGLRLELMGPIRIRIELFDSLVETLCRFTIGLRQHVLRVCPFGRSRGNGLQLNRSVFILSQCEQRGTQPEVGLGQVGLYSERASQGHKSLLEPSDSIITDTEKQCGSPSSTARSPAAHHLRAARCAPDRRARPSTRRRTGRAAAA